MAILIFGWHSSQIHWFGFDFNNESPNESNSFLHLPTHSLFIKVVLEILLLQEWNHFYINLLYSPIENKYPNPTLSQLSFSVCIWPLNPAMQAPFLYSYHRPDIDLTAQADTQKEEDIVVGLCKGISLLMLLRMSQKLARITSSFYNTFHILLFSYIPHIQFYFMFSNSKVRHLWRH